MPTLHQPNFTPHPGQQRSLGAQPGITGQQAIADEIERAVASAIRGASSPENLIEPVFLLLSTCRALWEAT